jgi:transcriptional regulator with XRE-family HTH domain
MSTFEEPAREDESPPGEQPREAEEPETPPEEPDLAPEDDEQEPAPMEPSKTFLECYMGQAGEGWDAAFFLYLSLSEEQRRELTGVDEEDLLELLTSRSAEYWALAFARFRDYIAFARSADPTLETDMPTTTDLPGIEAAREVLGLSLEEIARAVQTNPSTLYRWREVESTPNRSSQDRLKRLDELAAEIDRALDPEQIPYWLDAPASIFEGRSPREMVLEGRVETGYPLARLTTIRTGGPADYFARVDSERPEPGRYEP